ncbi:cell division protein FtsB [Orbus hercynius]|uniref:Cell division protein FtsB n=1 Tax=Orbus hercynius TaxID=593135 RepID=A0A495RHT9_9GAMM|nr:cell division protein FtsB [Orbus hercynius]RKS87087.1 cell division protein FtsB [Orbus hercynius]
MLAKWKLPILLCAILGYLQYDFWYGKNNFFDYKQNLDSVQIMHAENEKLKLRNERMFAEISNLYDGSDAIEERARSHLGMIAPDEHFYRIVSESSSLWGQE